MFPVICFHRPFGNPAYEELVSGVSGGLTQRSWLRLWKTFIIIIIARRLFSGSFPFASALSVSINIENVFADEQW